MIAEILDYIVGILWGPTLLIGLVGTGLYFTIITGFWQLRNLKRAFLFCLSPKKKSDGKQSETTVSPYQAAAVAIGSSIGSGNIGGVAGAIALGGPGALFWMWITALVGMMTKMVEVTLAVYYRKKEPDGKNTGGPLFYIEKGIGKKFKYWKPIAVLFGLGLCMQLVLSPENFSVGESLQELTGVRALYASIVFGILCFIVVCGGLKRVINFATLMMPIMSLLYIIFGAYVILLNVSELPAAFALIVKSAFQPTAAVGGFAGASFMLAARSGISRGLFSNEAGWGTSPMVHATADNKHPIEQGMWGIMEVFIDTIVVCSITGLVIIVTGEWSSGAAGVTLTMRAFSRGLGKFAAIFVAVSVFLFCWTTVTGWFSYFHSVFEFAFADNPRLKKASIVFLKFSAPGFGLLMTFLIDVFNVDTAYAWLIVDISSAIPTYVNLIVLICLTKVFLRILKDYEGPKKLYGLAEYDKVKMD
ncbi:MAG: sodium:alanine symporter family protein [Synergistaceae bacterium]|jgi:AGCS family alanine or glycine:cation symporter|nr:sodium:alanine symporter family protein [Synergistaceae bacterium]